MTMEGIESADNKPVKFNYDKKNKIWTSTTDVDTGSGIAGKLVIDPRTGEVTSLIGGKSRSCTSKICQTARTGGENLKKLGEATGDIKRTRIKKASGFMKFIGDVLTEYSKFKGLNQWTTFFIDEKEVAKKKAKILKDFCDNTLILGGTECWTSKICEKKVDATMGGTGVMTEGKDGKPKAAAHIEADRSEEIYFYDASIDAERAQWLYRISFSLHNPHDINMSYNIIFKNDLGLGYRVYEPDRQIKPGSSRRRVHRSALAKYSSSLYTTVCLEFRPEIERIGGGRVGQFCVPIGSSGTTVQKKLGMPQIIKEGGTTPPTRPDWEGF